MQTPTITRLSPTGSKIRRIFSATAVRNHEELLKSSDEIRQKLEEIRRSKAYEMMKYETIARMNAGSVSAYLRQERFKPSPVKPSTEIDELLQKHDEETKDQAACIIQQFFRKCVRRKQIQETLYSWQWIPIQKRLRYIEAIAERMSGGSIPRKTDLTVIKNKVSFFRCIIARIS
ncbi:unnamed protein product [Gongylonema pulchrum]|uniref:Uncharacterized protein n=1 Tax=Gongylonema pulchrum TaxID=637853 RepID=A0A183E145_9BILA|nr:unnamed protein product [Gongylonema pulchrum]